ncbi:bifunctional 2-polyprenyl-6-hydroxyphenol methylase/3-demethylubiquinol 3-O-methyltransferase UbiG [Planomicrobium sp. CPCC 101110]|uniref:class I SAM-dependent methyltransferase n=1 Tax=Planomicrobium sp. CPCC 101110 TaxID=2599619 RepID=UPI0011B583EE|nr:class I SAM-dependent methyltransferase [Planomicrobium sp. CPCC 101110]TWT26004.1 class I SAM-dependent methyltransferase [Planomicrobium sp. CPCC 101110]
MEFRGASVYDEHDFLSNYMKRRDRKDSPNNAIEGPIIFELLGDFQNKRVLDLGCGDAAFGKELLDQGAAFYTGVEGSMQMAASATLKMSNKNGTIHHEAMESYHFPTREFDIVTSRFAIHYVRDVHLLFRNVHKTLKDQGSFVFSVQHPLTTSSFASKKTGDRRGNWLVDDYFIEGERKEPWIEQLVVKYHRTTEHYFKALTKAGFSVVDLREGTPKREHFTNEEEYERRLRIPIVLAFSCTKQQD